MRMMKKGMNRGTGAMPADKAVAYAPKAGMKKAKPKKAMKSLYGKKGMM
jgi:hypothetical protein